MSDTSSTRNPRGRRPLRSSAELAAETDSIYAGLNILAEYRELGATFNGDDFKANGYIECYGFARADGSNDSNPSARVRDNGMYGDSGEGGREVHIWDVAAKLNGTTWQEEKRRYAEKAGVVLGGGKKNRGSRRSGLREEGKSNAAATPANRSKKSSSRKPAENPADVLRFEEWTDGRRRIVEIWIAKHRPGVSLAAIEANGGRVGVYLVGKGEKKYEIRVLALPIYGQPLDSSGQPIAFDSSAALAAAMLAAGPLSCGIWSLNPHPTNGTPLMSKNRDTGELTPIKMKTVGLADGVYGRRSLEIIAAGIASPSAIQSAWKVEGPTDLLSVDAAAIAEGLAGEVVTLSPAGGAGSFNPWMADLFAGLPTNVIGDDDKAGQDGADKASSVLFSSRKPSSVVRCYLGGEIKPKHGADVRDYFNEPNQGERHTYSDFAGLAAFGVAWDEELEAGYRKERAADAQPTSPQAVDEGDSDSETSNDPANDLQPIEAGDDPHRLARVYLESYATKDGICTLRRWREEWHKWSGREYRQIGEAEIKDSLNFAVKEEFNRLNIEAQEIFNERDTTAADYDPDAAPPVARKVTRTLVSDVNAAMCGLCPLPSDSDAPFWIDGNGPFPANEIFATGSGLIHLKSLFNRDRPEGDKSLYQIPVTANFFSPTAVDYRFPEDDMTKCKPPERWYDFLRSLWGDDFQMIQLLQEWMGYCLLPDTSQQKIMLLIGPPRSGKGTISRVLTELVGELNVVNPRLSSFGTEFGIEPLIGKTLGIVSDARLSGRSDLAQIVETLLSISGEDKQTVRRMYKSSINTRLRLRFMIVSNELPALQDASGAFLNRCMLLQTTKSFLGNEDRLLEEALRDELPGIMVWAAQGWYSLRERGSFVQPESSRELLNELYALTSPIKAFIDECCEVGPDTCGMVDEVYTAYRHWCERQGRKSSTKQMFGRDLRASMPHISTEQISANSGGRARAFFGLKLLPEYRQGIT